MVQLLTEKGIPLVPEGSKTDEELNWFKTFLRKKGKERSPKHDFATIEEKLNLKLPPSYLEFMTQIGSGSFYDVDGEEGTETQLLDPADLGIGGYAEGDFEDEESNAINGLMFASTDFGDCYVFDVKEGQQEYAVYRYNHEAITLDLYAENFIACLRRFVGE